MLILNSTRFGTLEVMKGGIFMIFIIVPEYPEIISWTEILRKCQRNIMEEYGNRFDVYKIITSYQDSEEEYLFTLLDFYMNEDYMLQVKDVQNVSFSDNNRKEFDEYMESVLLKLDKKKSVCIVPSTSYLNIARFMEPTIHIQLFMVSASRTGFQLIKSSIVPLKEFGSPNKKEEYYNEIHSLYTSK